ESSGTGSLWRISNRRSRESAIGKRWRRPARPWPTLSHISAQPVMPCWWLIMFAERRLRWMSWWGRSMWRRCWRAFSEPSAWANRSDGLALVASVAERLGFGKPASAELHHPRDLRRGRNQLPAFVVTHYHRALDMVGPGWLPGHGGAGSFVRH